jgi:hypothetical protein
MSEGTSAGLDVNGFARGPVASVHSPPGKKSTTTRIPTSYSLERN